MSVERAVPIPVEVTAETGTIVMPTENHHVLAKYYKVTDKEVKMAVDAAMAAHKAWADMPWIERASIMQKIAALVSGKYRYKLIIKCRNTPRLRQMAARLLVSFATLREFQQVTAYADPNPYRIL